MEWSNAKALEFLELFRTEPCLWDQKLQWHKNRTAANDAWRRIIQSLSFPVTYEELKNKKESLMGYYRIHLNKYKKSLKRGATGYDVYTTSWFAFEVMDSFLRPIYGPKSIITTETRAVSPEEYDTEDDMNESTEIKYQNRFFPISSTSTGACSNIELDRPSASTTSRNMCTSNCSHELISANKLSDDPCHCSKSTTSHRMERFDEYDHFAFMIASKIRKMDNVDDREILMNSIQNLMFDFYMKHRRSGVEAQSTIKYH